MIEPPVLVGLGPCSAAIHGVSYDSSFSTLKLSALKQWLFRLVRVCRPGVLRFLFPWIVNVHVDAKLLRHFYLVCLRH